jgi:hypothetical protein
MEILPENIGTPFGPKPCHLCGRLISHLAQNKGHLPAGSRRDTMKIVELNVFDVSRFF